jgi:hypothetical protein
MRARSCFVAVGAFVRGQGGGGGHVGDLGGGGAVWAWRRAHVSPPFRVLVAGLAFLAGGKILVSAGRDARVFLWSLGTVETYTEEREIDMAPVHTGGQAPAKGESMAIATYPSSVSFVVVHPQQLALYSATSSARQQAWGPHPGSVFQSPITAATFSAAGTYVYVAFSNASIGIFDGKLLCPLGRLGSAVIDPNGAGVWPVSIAGQPQVEKGAQVAVGLSDGKVLLLEPTGGASGASWLNNT